MSKFLTTKNVPQVAKHQTQLEDPKDHYHCVSVLAGEGAQEERAGAEWRQSSRDGRTRF